MAGNTVDQLQDRMRELYGQELFGLDGKGADEIRRLYEGFPPGVDEKTNLGLHEIITPQSMNDKVKAGTASPLFENAFKKLDKMDSLINMIHRTSHDR